MVDVGGTSHGLKSLLEHKLNEVFTFADVTLHQLKHAFLLHEFLGKDSLFLSVELQVS